MNLFRRLLLVVWVLFLSACVAGPAATQGPAATPASPSAIPPQNSATTSTTIPAQTSTLAPTRPAAALTPATPSPAGKTSLPADGAPTARTQLMLGSQVVQINAQDLMTVRTAAFTLTGQAPAGSVVSVNDDFSVVGEKGSFSFPITLEEGPNLLEVVASNPQGQQASVDLVVVYDPAP